MWKQKEMLSGGIKSVYIYMLINIESLTCIHARLRSKQNCLHQLPFPLTIVVFLLFVVFLKLTLLVSEVAYNIDDVCCENDSTRPSILLWEV